MADVFISYAKPDRDLVVRLAALLEANGYTTWWDTSLLTGDDFRKVIMQELGRARAAIVVWTPNSISSDWVRSEAGRAQADRKLIPVKLVSVTYKDIPPPFDVLHTENNGDDDKILAAVVAQLAKPAVEPTTFAVISKAARYQFLTYFGIIGGAITLFTNVRSLIDLADWAQFLVMHWHQLTHAFWNAVFAWANLKVGAEWYPLLSFTVFWLSLASAARMRATGVEVAIGMPRMKLFRWQLPLPLGLLFLAGWLGIFIGLVDFFEQETQELSLARILFVVAGWCLAMTFYILEHERRALTAMVFILFIFSQLLVFRPIDRSIRDPTVTLETFDTLVTVELYSMALIAMLIAAVRFVAPIRTVNRRLIALAGTLVLLTGLNYGSLAVREIVGRLP